MLNNFDKNTGELTFFSNTTTITSEMISPYRDHVKKIIIPDGVTRIAENAFYGCSDLTEITIPDGVISLGSGAFSDCSSLTKITIPDSVTEIGDYAFYGCSALTEINIPDSVTRIARKAFANCSGLTEITLPDGVTEIGSGAFENCTGLTEITIPDGVTSIGRDTFAGCSGLTSITIPDSVTEIESEAFSCCYGLTKITIPDGVTKIEKGVFTGCSGLTSITIPKGVTSIGEFAFYYCRGLTSITIPKSVTAIGESAFKSCRGLTEITIPDGVTEIESETFSGCSGLTKITIPDGVTRIAENAFAGCTSLTSIIRTSIYRGPNAFELPLCVEKEYEPEKDADFAADPITLRRIVNPVYIPADNPTKGDVRYTPDAFEYASIYAYLSADGKNPLTRSTIMKTQNPDDVIDRSNLEANAEKIKNSMDKWLPNNIHKPCPDESQSQTMVDSSTAVTHKEMLTDLASQASPTRTLLHAILEEDGGVDFLSAFPGVLHEIKPAHLACEASGAAKKLYLGKEDKKSQSLHDVLNTTEKGRELIGKIEGGRSIKVDAQENHKTDHSRLDKKQGSESDNSPNAPQP